MTDDSDSKSIKKGNIKEITDSELQKKSVKLVVLHMRRKIEDDIIGINHVLDWLNEMNQLLSKEDFVRAEYMEMRRKLNEAIERVMDVEMRSKLRNSWYSYGKALEKKVPRN